MSEPTEKSNEGKHFHNLTDAEHSWNNEGGHQPMREKREPIEGPPVPETLINRVALFPDGSRLTILVEAPAGVDHDLASEAYNYHILPGLKEIESERTRSHSLTE